MATVCRRAKHLNITAILSNWTTADSDDRDSVFARMHTELSRIAARQLSGESGADVLLEPGMLVNETFLKLVDLNAMTWQGRAHFLATAARIMRQVLLDHARRRHAAKRNGGVQVQLTLASVEVPGLSTNAFLLEDALTQLSTIEPLHAKVVEARFFGGLTIEETAEALGVSPRTVKRAWASAQAWLAWYVDQGK